VVNVVEVECLYVFVLSYPFEISHSLILIVTFLRFRVVLYV